MKKLACRLFFFLFIAVFYPNMVLADGETITHEGVIYKRTTGNQLAIVDFVPNETVGVYQIVRHVEVDRQEYTVVNQTPLQAKNMYHIDSIAIPEFAPDLFAPSDLRKLEKLCYLKIDAKALGEYHDYRMVAKHLTGDRAVSIDFYSFPEWAKRQNGMHYSSDGRTLLFTGTPKCIGGCVYLPFNLRRIAPYALGPVIRNTFFIVPPTIESISPTQIKRREDLERVKRGLIRLKDDKSPYLVIDNCFEPVENLHIEEPVDEGPELQLAFAISAVGEGAGLHYRTSIKSKYVVWRSTFYYNAGGTIFPGGLPLTITTGTTSSNINKYSGPKWNKPWYSTKRVSEETTLKWTSFNHYKIEPMPDPDRRLLGFLLVDGPSTTLDTIRTSKAFCWGIGQLNVQPLYTNKDQFVEGIDYLLSSDRKTLKWWNNMPSDSSLAHLNIPTVVRCAENFLINPPKGEVYKFPTQILQVGPRSISNIKNLRELIIDHDVTLEKSSLAGCLQLLLIRCVNNRPLPENAIRDAFYPDSVPRNLMVIVPEDRASIWEDVKDKLGAPLVHVPDSITLINRKSDRSTLKVQWRSSIHDSVWREVETDSIVLPSLALFKVNILPKLIYDFDGVCLLSDSSEFTYSEINLATKDLSLYPKCHVVRYPVRYSVYANGTMSVATTDGRKAIDSGMQVNRGTKVAFDALAAPHYRFARFTVNGQSIFQNPYVKETRSSLDVIAYFRPILHPVSFDKDNECPWVVLDTADVPVPVRELGNGMYSVDSVAENVRYTFCPKPSSGKEVYQATINGKRIAGADTTLVIGGPVKLSAFVKRKKCFINVPDADVYGNLMLRLASGTLVSPNTSVPWGEQITIKSNISSRYFKFDSLVVNGMGYQDEQITIPADSDTITVDLLATPINFLVYIEPDNRFSVSVTSEEPVNSEFQDLGYWGVVPDQHISIAINAKPGWIVKSMDLMWEEGDVESIPGALKECKIQSNLSVKPVLMRKFYHISLQAKKKSGGVLVYNKNNKKITTSTKLSYGDTIVILPQAGKGYELKTLSINGVIVPPRQQEYIVTSDMKVVAFFDKLSYGKTDTLVLENHTTILRYAGSLKIKDVNFNKLKSLQAVKIIAAEAFAYNPHITSVYLEGKVEVVEGRAFYGCPNLRKVTLGQNVRYVGAQAFADAEQLEVIDILQTDPDSLLIDPAIFQKTRGVDPQYVFRVANDVYEAFRSHPKWQHVTVVPQTVEWVFKLESAEFQLNVDVEEFGGNQQHFAILQGQNSIILQGGCRVEISSAASAPQTVTRVAISGAASVVPCVSKALENRTIMVLQHEVNKKMISPVNLEKHLEELVQVAPNPVKGQLKIFRIGELPIRYKLLNIWGVELDGGIMASELIKLLDVSRLDQGLYILTVENGRASQTLRIVKQ